MSGMEKDLRDFLSKYPNEPHSIHREGGHVSFQILIDEDLVGAARRFGDLKVIYNATEVGRARQSQVGKGNRFKGGEIPIGLGLRR